MRYRETDRLRQKKKDRSIKGHTETKRHIVENKPMILAALSKTLFLHFKSCTQHTQYIINETKMCK